MSAEDYEIDYDRPCPKCGHEVTHYRTCQNIECEDGFIDEYDDDPINFRPGETFTPCPDCHGFGVEWWCPGCGTNLNENRKLNDLEDEQTL